MGTGYFPGVKRPGRGADHPPLLVPRSRKSRAITLPLPGPSGLLGRTFTLCAKTEFLPHRQHNILPSEKQAQFVSVVWGNDRCFFVRIKQNTKIHSVDKTKSS
jgi:hypothetical protein